MHAFLTLLLAAASLMSVNLMTAVVRPVTVINLSMCAILTELGPNGAVRAGCSVQEVGPECSNESGRRSRAVTE